MRKWYAIKSMGILIENKEMAKTFNRMAREQMKSKLLADILVDLQVCDIEGWDKREYIRELQMMINDIKIW